MAKLKNDPAMVVTEPGAIAQAAEAITETPPAVKPPKRFRVYVPNPQFAGERFGVSFAAGVGETNDPIVAHNCLEIGPGVYYEDRTKGTRTPPLPATEPDATADPLGVAKK